MSTAQYNIVIGIVMVCAGTAHGLYICKKIKMWYMLATLLMAYAIAAAASLVYSISRI